MMDLAFHALSVAILLSAGEDGRPSAVVDGHQIRVETITTSPFMMKDRQVRHVSISFAVEPKDAGKSFAYELGQRFVAFDAAGKEIPLGRAQSSFMMRGEPEFRLAGYPTAANPARAAPFRDSMSVTIPSAPSDSISWSCCGGVSSKSKAAMRNWPAVCRTRLRFSGSLE